MAPSHFVRTLLHSPSEIPSLTPLSAPASGGAIFYARPTSLAFAVRAPIGNTSLEHLTELLRLGTDNKWYWWPCVADREARYKKSTMDTARPDGGEIYAQPI